MLIRYRLAKFFCESFNYFLNLATSVEAFSVTKPFFCASLSAPIKFLPILLIFVNLIEFLESAYVTVPFRPHQYLLYQIFYIK